MQSEEESTTNQVMENQESGITQSQQKYDGGDSSTRQQRVSANEIGQDVLGAIDPANPRFKSLALVENKAERDEMMGQPQPSNAWRVLQPRICTKIVAMGDVELDSGISGLSKRRVYVGSVVSSQMPFMNPESESHSHIYWSIKFSGKSVRDLLTGSEFGNCTESIFTPRMSEMLSSSMAKKIPEGTVRRISFDLCAIVMRAAACLAQYSLCGRIRESDLTGNTKGSVFSGGLTGLPEYHEGGIFIPPSTSVTNSYYLSTLIRLAWGCNTVVTVCNMQVHGDRVVPVLDEHRPQETAATLVKIISHIFEMYMEVGRGPEAILAYTVGIHSVMSVVSHSDEGGIVRDAMRSVNYTIPYGPVLSMEVDCGALGMPLTSYGSDGWCNYVAWIDSFAISTAALVMISDPGVYLGDTIVPTILQANSSHDFTSQEWKQDLAKQQRLNISTASAQFSYIYCYNLGKMVGMDNVDGRQFAKNVFNGALTRTRFKDRHVSMPVVAPWYWVEATCWFKDVKWAESIGAGAGWGLMCTNEGEVLPSLDDAKVQFSDTGVTKLVMPPGSLRKHAYIQHIFKAQKDGLVFMRAKYLDKHGVLLRGQKRERHSVEHEVETFEGRDADEAKIAYPFEDYDKYTTRMDNMLWGHRDCGLLAPAECMFTAEWFLEIRCSAYSLRRSRVVHVLRADVDDLIAGVKMKSTRPCLCTDVDHLTSKSDSMVSRKNINAQALDFARKGYSHTFINSFEVDVNVRKYAKGANRERKVNNANLRAELYEASKTTGSALGARPPVVLSEMRASMPSLFPVSRTPKEILRSLPSRTDDEKTKLGVNDQS